MAEEKAAAPVEIQAATPPAVAPPRILHHRSVSEMSGMEKALHARLSALEIKLRDAPAAVAASPRPRDNTSNLSNELLPKGSVSPLRFHRTIDSHSWHRAVVNLNKLAFEEAVITPEELLQHTRFVSEVAFPRGFEDEPSVAIEHDSDDESGNIDTTTDMGDSEIAVTTNKLRMRPSAATSSYNNMDDLDIDSLTGRPPSGGPSLEMPKMGRQVAYSSSSSSSSSSPSSPPPPAFKIQTHNDNNKMKRTSMQTEGARHYWVFDFFDKAPLLGWFFVAMFTAGSTSMTLRYEAKIRQQTKRASVSSSLDEKATTIITDTKKSKKTVPSNRAASVYMRSSELAPAKARCGYRCDRFGLACCHLEHLQCTNVLRKLVDFVTCYLAFPWAVQVNIFLLWVAFGQLSKGLAIHERYKEQCEALLAEKTSQTISLRENALDGSMSSLLIRDAMLVAIWPFMSLWIYWYMRGGLCAAKTSEHDRLAMRFARIVVLMKSRFRRRLYTNFRRLGIGLWACYTAATVWWVYMITQYEATANNYVQEFWGIACDVLPPFLSGPVHHCSFGTSAVIKAASAGPPQMHLHNRTASDALPWFVLSNDQYIVLNGTFPRVLAGLAADGHMVRWLPAFAGNSTADADQIRWGVVQGGSSDLLALFRMPYSLKALTAVEGCYVFAILFSFLALFLSSLSVHYLQAEDLHEVFHRHEVGDEESRGQHYSKRVSTRRRRPGERAGRITYIETNFALVRWRTARVSVVNTSKAFEKILVVVISMLSCVFLEMAFEVLHFDNKFSVGHGGETFAGTLVLVVAVLVFLLVMPAMVSERMYKVYTQLREEVDLNLTPEFRLFQFVKDNQIRFKILGTSLNMRLVLRLFYIIFIAGITVLLRIQSLNQSS